MYKHVLVPISFDEDRDASGAADVAKTLVDKDGRITLLHVIEQIPAYAVSYVPPDYLVESRKSIEAELSTMAQELSNAAGVVVSGHSSRTILDWSEANDVDCIVLASHRPGMQDLLLGSTAAKVVRHAGCAVHVVR